jgi:hypothetical protein
MLWCFWSKIQTGILFLQITTSILTEKPSAYLSPLYPLIFGIIFFIFWLIAIIGELAYLNSLEHQRQLNPSISTSTPNALLTLWIIYFIFMAEFLYYVQTFLISTCCSHWYYRITSNYFTHGVFTLNRYHLGSLTFAALIITFLNLLKRIARE